MSSEEANDFLKRLQVYLNCQILPPRLLRDDIRRIVKEAKASPPRSKERCKAFPEGAFLNTYVAPRIHEYLVNEEKLPPQEAKNAFLSEAHGSLSGIACGSPKRPEKHPFKKIIGVSATNVFKAWQGMGEESPVAGNYPDMALRKPCKVVFEGKYFERGSRDAAGKELVTGIYQSFFYLGLPWDYEYACFLACDATDAGTLVSAWNDIQDSVKKACWKGANIFVMLLRNGNSQPT